MGQPQQMIPLDSVINDYLSESEQSNSKYFRLWHLAFRGMEQLGIDIFYQIKSILLPVNPNYTVTLPADYLMWLKVGYLNSLGEVCSLKQNDNLSTFADLNPNRLSRIAGNTSILNFYSPSSSTYYNFYNPNWGYGNLYGLPTTGGYGGQFKVDDFNGVILLDTYWMWNEIVLEYTASPVEGEEYFLPMQFREALIAWLAWKDIQNTVSRSHMNLGDKDRRRNEFYNERRLAIARYKPFRLDQFYLNNIEATRLTAKA